MKGKDTCMSNYIYLQNRLNQEEKILLDGAMGTEILRRKCLLPYRFGQFKPTF